MLLYTVQFQPGSTRAATDCGNSEADVQAPEPSCAGLQPEKPLAHLPTCVPSCGLRPTEFLESRYPEVRASTASPRPHLLRTALKLKDLQLQVPRSLLPSCPPALSHCCSPLICSRTQVGCVSTRRWESQSVVAQPRLISLAVAQIFWKQNKETGGGGGGNLAAN